MHIETTVAPVSPPVSLATFRADRRIAAADTSFDAELTVALAAATAAAEAELAQRLVTQTVRLTTTNFAPAIWLPAFPIQSVSSVVYDDGDGAAQTLAGSGYSLVRSVRPHLLVPAYGAVWPTPRAHWDSVRITLVVGYGAPAEGSAPYGDVAAVPADIRQAILLIAGDFFEQREDTAMGVSVMPIPRAAERLLRPHRFHW